MQENRDTKGRYLKGHSVSLENIEASKLANFGKRRSPDTEFKKGNIPWYKIKFGLDYSEEKHPRWVGDNTAYETIHSWVEKHLGLPRVCWNCGTEKAKRYDWANLSGLYKRNLEDFVRLCRSCHKIMDGGWF